MRAELGIDAGRAEEEEAVNIVEARGFDDVGLDDEVVADEVRGVVVVREDAAYLRCGEDYVFWFFFSEEGVYGFGVEQVEFFAGAGEEVGVALLLDGADL